LFYHQEHNATKLTEGCRDLWVKCQTADHAVRSELQDTGVGVAADNLPSLWEGFTQMADPLRRGVEGWGWSKS
jgi:C4-dicarboxylate-specific signal transduction histidine kinase